MHTQPPGGRPLPREEIRFGVVLNGGVSLAVWMGGAALELDHLTKASDEDEHSSVYARLLALAGCTARADVIAGTSAGGINGAALALSQVNRCARLADLRDIWVDQGRIESLLRQPFRGSPTSLLRGDEFFLPRLNEALTRLAVPHDVRKPHEAPIDLTITTTVLRGNQTVSVDSMGRRMPQELHAASFHWRRLPLQPEGTDPFAEGTLERTAHRMALAARSTASFPIAFEPVFVPVHSPRHPEPDPGSPLTQEQRLRPDMASCVDGWGDGVARDRSRFAVDGGLLANTPTRAALEAVEAMPAAGPVRRVMLLVYPHAPEPGSDLPDSEMDAPSVTGTVGGLLGALTAQGSRTFVDELERHNVAASGRRGTRGDVLRSITRPEDLDELAGCLFVHFRRLRRWRAGRDLARALAGLDSQAEPAAAGGTAPEGWSFERIRRAAERAQDAWERRWGAPEAAGTRPRLPYVPDSAPATGRPQPDQGWGWGVDGALGVAEASADVVRRLVWVLPEGAAYDAVRSTREQVSMLRARIAAERHQVDDRWTSSDLVRGLTPDETYWTLRLAFYDLAMTGTDDGELERLVAEVARSEGEREQRRTSPERGEQRRRDVLGELRRVLVDQAPEPGSVGAAVRHHVDAIVEHLAEVLPILHSSVWTPPDLVVDTSLEELSAWDRTLAVDLPAVDRQTLLTRLLQVEVASTTIGDEVATGATLPVEVVQLSAQTPNAFTRHTRTGDDKLGGMSVNRFGGFLKRSWRVNDWTWGRVDAATVLARTVLSPERVRRAAVLGGLVDGEGTAGSAARAVVAAVVDDLLGEEVAADPRVTDLVVRAVEELTETLDLTVPTGDLPAGLPALADLFAWARHLEVVPEELPALAAAVRADGVEGANARSRGEVFLEESAPLLQRLEEGAAAGRIARHDRAEALVAFDRAGVGREPIREEVSSDLTLRTATTAAAVTATVLDSDRSGLGAVRPVTRAVRGAVVLPYWVVTALTSRAVLARSLALLGLTVGAVLLALALFGVLPEGLTGPAALVGASAVLVAVGYGALPCGTMLHGLVLLTPVVPLLAYAASQAGGADATADPTAQGVATLLVVVALALALMLLGSLPASSGSVWSALDRLATRRGLAPVAGPTSGAGRGVANAWRRTRGLARLALRVLLVLGAVALVAAVATWLVTDPWSSVHTFLRENATPLAVVGGALLLVGAVAAWRFGRLLQVLRQAGSGDEGPWEYSTLAHPAGAVAGWAVLYGACYLVLAALLVWDPVGVQDEPWAAALLAVSIVLGVFLGLVLPLLAPFRALREAERREVARARTTPRPPEPRPRALAVDLADRGVAYRWLVSDRPAPDAPPPTLTRRGRRLERRVDAAREPDRVGARDG